MTSGIGMPVAGQDRVMDLLITTFGSETMSEFSIPAGTANNNNNNNKTLCRIKIYKYCMVKYTQLFQRFP